MADEFMEMLFRVIPARVTRKEYEEMFLAMTRLTDRIEALEKRHPEPGTWHAHRDLPVEWVDDDTYSS